jgi:hypothetical protein
VEFAQSRGLTTIGLLGFNGGALKKQVDDYLWIQTEKGAYGLVESFHTLLCHILTDCLARGLVLDGDSDRQNFQLANGRVQVAS